MLVLTRQKDERLFLGPNIILTVLEIRGNKVRIGIDAPKDVEIAREEVASFTPVTK